MTKEELQQMTGANDYTKPTLMKLKTMRLHGDTGKFVITHLDKPKGADDRYEQTEIEGAISVVFLKVRRKLFEGSRDGIEAQTNEHNTPNDVVNLWRKGEKEAVRGVARELRSQYENLRTEQIVYVRYKGEIYRLSVKGASLSGTDETTNFYQYLTSFNDLEIGFWDTQTRLVPTEGGDGKRSYYFIDFQMGDALTDEQKQAVYENIKTVHDNCKKVDEYYDSATVPNETPDPVAHTQVKDYPDEEINPEDIPF